MIAAYIPFDCFCLVFAVLVKVQHRAVFLLHGHPLLGTEAGVPLSGDRKVVVDDIFLWLSYVLYVFVCDAFVCARGLSF